MKQSLFVALVMAIFILPGLLLFGACSEPDEGAGPKAAIIDQLYSLHPNQEFIAQMTELLEDSGFTVDLYQGKQVDVKFYKELPKHGYRLIIFRAHSGGMALPTTSGAMVKGATYLFTDEAYTERKYVIEQLDDQLLPAEITKDYPNVFAINSKFITESMKDTFNNAVIIMMGCSTTYLDDLAFAFFGKGASVYLGWDGLVGTGYVDEATIYLVQRLLVDSLTIQGAAASTMTEKGPDPNFGAVLRYYPQKVSANTVQELITGKNEE